jgi:hypothetical protein
VPGSKTLVTARDATTTVTETYSFANAIAESQRAAMGAQAQLAGDIAQIESINDGLRRFNDLVMGVAQAATGKSPGRAAKDWRDLLARGKGDRYAARPQPATKPTVDEMVPLAYVPDLVVAVDRQIQTSFLTRTFVDT